MAEIIEDPVVRQRYRLTLEGDVLRNEVEADPGAEVPEHYHPSIEERFEVLEGDLTFWVDGRARPAGPGERFVVPAGTRHRFENTGPGVGRFVAEIEPALDMKAFFEESAALARAGMFSKPGRPKGLRGTLAVAEFAQRFRETTVMTSPPEPVQRLFLPPLARLARRS